MRGKDAISQEIHALLRAEHPILLRMQTQAEPLKEVYDPLANLPQMLLVVVEDHHIVHVTDVEPTPKLLFDEVIYTSPS